MRALRPAALKASIAAGFLALFGTASSCASVPDSGRFTVILQPDFNTYRDHVDLYMRRRCGTLDCHGQPGRALRFYGREGFRLYNEDAGLISGSQPTTPEETQANFQAIIALEPEEMSRVVATQAQGDDPKRLLFIRKPLKLERHKGGPAMAEDDPGYRCVVAWLRVPVFRIVDSPDGPVAEPIPPGQRQALTPRQIADCDLAQSYP